MWVVRKPSWTLKNGVCGGLGGAAGDQAEVAGLLGVAGEDHAPAAVGDRHHVVVAGVDVQPLAGQRAAPMFMTTGSRLPEIV